MKKLLFFALSLNAFLSFSQVHEPFLQAGVLNGNGWTRHSGTAGQFTTLSGTLNYSGLPTSTGNKATFVAGNSEDINIPTSAIYTDSAYFSFILRLPSDAGLALNSSLTGENFMGFGQQVGAAVTTFGGQIRIRKGSVAGKFQLAVLNQGAAAAQPAFYSDLDTATNYFIVVKLKKTDIVLNTVSASMWINPTLGLASETAATQISTLGTGAITQMASVYLRQNGTATTGTGNSQVDELRIGNTWAFVTPSGCATTNNLTINNCGTYTLNGTPYTSSGNYSQTLVNANSLGCDSIINLSLTVNNATSSTIDTTSCGAVTINSTVYSSTGTFVQTIPNAVICDSVITINVTIVGSITYYQDSDNDGFGNPSVSQNACVAPVGYVSNNTDCNDANPSVTGQTTYYQDNDNDGFGNASVSQMACSAPVGYVTSNNDCDDANVSLTVPTIWYLDNDNDTYGNAATSLTQCTQPLGYVSNNTDCNDASVGINPGATEIPNNGIDEDCSGADLNTLGTILGMYEFTGNDCPTPFLAVTTQPTDATFSNYFRSDSLNCTAAANVFNSNSLVASTNFDSTNYLGFSVTIDSCFEGNLTAIRWQHRVSASGGTPTISIRSNQDGFATDLSDVTITTPGTLSTETIFLPASFANVTGNIEFRFYVTDLASTGASYRHDNVTLFATTSALPQLPYYSDNDGDGFGDPATMVMNCIPTAGMVLDSTDCNDSDSTQFPGAIWYADTDNDGIGNTAITQTSCLQPIGYVSISGDCNDTDAGIVSPQIYFQDMDNDGVGNTAVSQTSCTSVAGYVLQPGDCDDNDSTVTIPNTTYFFDADGDGFGAGIGLIICSPGPGFVTNSLDCNDSLNIVNPNTAEVCDGLDNNCNGLIDENILPVTYYQDADGDGFGNNLMTIVNCLQPIGYVVDSTDCDDSNDQVFLGATEVLNNGIDENCDGVDNYLSINELELSNVTLFPNPSASNIIISNLEKGTVSFKTIEGKEVFVIQTATDEFNVSDLSTGIYFVTIQIGKAQKTIQFVKQ